MHPLSLTPSSSHSCRTDLCIPYSLHVGKTLLIDNWCARKVVVGFTACLCQDVYLSICIAYAQRYILFVCILAIFAVSGVPAVEPRYYGIVVKFGSGYRV